MLEARGRIALDRDVATWVEDVLREEVVSVAPLTPSAAVAAAALGDAFPGDPADRFLYATAEELRVPFVTKDERLHAYAETRRGVDLVW